jgi:hypothetical protein
MKYLLLAVIIPVSVIASELVFQFKSPTFNGIGYSTHQLSKEQISFNRKKSIADEIASIALQAQLADDRSALNMFLTNVQARIYSELAKQVTEQLFADDGQESGTFTLEGNQITWYKSADDQIYLTVSDLLAGTTTEIIIPVGTLFIPTPAAETTDGDG